MGKRPPTATGLAIIRRRTRRRLVIALFAISAALLAANLMPRTSSNAHGWGPDYTANLTVPVYRMPDGTLRVFSFDEEQTPDHAEIRAQLPFMTGQFEFACDSDKPRSWLTLLTRLLFGPTTGTWSVNRDFQGRKIPRSLDPMIIARLRSDDGPMLAIVPSRVITSPTPVTVVYWASVVRAVVISSLLIAAPVIAATLAVDLRRVRAMNRRAKRIHCPSCDYDLSQTESSVCPECGTPRTDRAPDRVWPLA